ncbi:SPFH domain-containing protein [Chitinimonas lacunae]|uniref:SPFH domain-containing protein n=1 Tax=Chitinimonas lacunae TaxID=1963018 RepID=A0ABV8MQN9_9NEIS
MQTPTPEISYTSHNGYLALLSSLLVPLLVTGAVLLLAGTDGLLIAPVLFGISLLIGGGGLYMLQPNQAAVLTLFGDYRGTDRSQGLRWANPFLIKNKISLRARNFVCDKLKVNDKRGNPIEIAAAVVWRVNDTAQATFGVDDYEQYVHLQSETALRQLASCYAYDHLDEDEQSRELTLRNGGEALAQLLRRELEQRLQPAGVTIEDAKLTHLAYALEIAGAMLRRQQAEAVLAARRKIVEGAVGMVEAALHGLSEKGLLELDDERRAAMVTNLLVVLVSEKDATPVINSGTLYN